MDGDWTHPVAHANEDVPKDHTHDGCGCSEDRKGGVISHGEYTRMMCVIGCLVERLLKVSGQESLIVTQEELVRVSTKNLKMGFDQAGLAIILKVED